MERNAHYALVGLISMLLFLGMIVFVFWLAKFQFTKQYDIYDVDFKGPVRGLSSGGQVFFNGIKVGEVTKLSLDKADPNRVVARIRTTSDAPVRIDSTATLEPLGITGVNYIEIDAGTTSKPLLKDAAPANTIPVIRTKVGALESLLSGGGDVLTRTVEALDRVNRLLSDKNIASVSRHAGRRQHFVDHDFEKPAAAPRRRRRDHQIDRRDLAEDQPSSLRTATIWSTATASARLKNLADAADQIKSAAQDARATLAKIQGPTTDFATNGLPRISSAIVSLQSAAESLDRVVQDIETNPQGVLSKAPAKQIEVKP